MTGVDLMHDFRLESWRVNNLIYGMHVHRNKHDLSENHSSMIQMSLKVFSTSVFEKQRFFY